VEESNPSFPTPLSMLLGTWRDSGGHLEPFLRVKSTSLSPYWYQPRNWIAKNFTGDETFRSSFRSLAHSQIRQSPPATLYQQLAKIRLFLLSPSRVKIPGRRTRVSGPGYLLGRLTGTVSKTWEPFTPSLRHPPIFGFPSTFLGFPVPTSVLVCGTSGGRVVPSIVV